MAEAETILERRDSGLYAIKVGILRLPGDTLTTRVVGYNSVGIQNLSLAAVDPNLSFQASIDDEHWSTYELFPVSGFGAQRGAFPGGGFDTFETLFQAPTGGVLSIRIRLNSLTSGAVQSIILLSQGPARSTEKLPRTPNASMPVGIRRTNGNLRVPWGLGFALHPSDERQDHVAMAVTLRTLGAYPDGQELGVASSPLRQAPTPLPGTFTRAPFTITTASTTTIVAGVAGQQIRVYKGLIASDGGNSLQVRSGPTPIGGILDFVNGSQMVLPYDSEPWYICAPGDPLVFVTTGNKRLGGHVQYTQGV